MSEFEKLRALLDVAPAEARSTPKTASHDSEALRSPVARRRRRLWLFGSLLAILAFDALYLVVKHLVIGPQ